MKLSLSLAAVALLAAPLLAGDTPKKPNVVLVMADDQGWGDMAYNGHPHLKTPNFDALSKEAIRFDQFHAAAPVCSPTRASVLTGRTPNRMATFKWGHPIRPQETTLAQVLKSAGYRTGHFGKWHLGSVQKDGMCTPGKCGFDEWVSAPNFFDLDPILSVGGKATEFKGDSSDITADLALKFIRTSAEKKEPFFAVVWFGSPHDPHRALADDKKPYADRPAAEANFLGEMTAMDRAFGRVRKEIKELGLTDNTILWYCSDNGALPKVGSTGGRRGFKGQVYEGGLLVPAMLEWPSRYPKPQVIDVPCVTSDIYPTVLEWTGAKAERQPPLDGSSLVPLLDGKTKTRAKPIGFWDHPTAGVGTPSKDWMESLLADQKAGREPSDPKRLFSDAGKLTTKYPTDRFPGHSAWLDGNWKLHRIEAAKGGKGDGVKWELYDLAADPKESRDLSAMEPKRLEAMKKELTDWLGCVVRSLNGEDYPKQKGERGSGFQNLTPPTPFPAREGGARQPAGFKPLPLQGRGWGGVCETNHLTELNGPERPRNGLGDSLAGAETGDNGSRFPPTQPVNRIMAVLSFPDFVAALQQFPLLHPESRGQLAPLQEQFPDALKLGEELIRRGMLTPLQADRIVRGRQSELFLGRYTLIDRLGEGGAGQVYKAWDTENSRFVALKVLRGELVADPDTVSRFHREISVSSQLPPHPHVIGTLDAGRVGDTHFLAMEYVQGTDLDHLVKNTGPQSVARSCELIRQTALGLQHAHEHGLVHRDIKPSNLMLSGPGDGTVKILDLGLARLHADFGCGRENTFKTNDGSVTLGTVDYQAPEQALDFHATDIRADIYSLGCTFYYLLTGSPPFGAGPLAVKLMRHQQAEPPDLCELRPDVPPGLIPIVSRMLAKNPADRYATPVEVAVALTELLQPPPEPKTRPAQKQSPPRKSVSRLLIGAVGAIAVSVLLLVAVLPSTGRSRTSPPADTGDIPTAATPATPRPKPPPAPDSVEATVPEAADYQLVYDLNLANLSKNLVYDVDRRNRITRPFDRIAYFVELQKPEESRQYLYVSMAAFTRDLGEIGVPTFDSGARFQTNVVSMNVFSNVAGIVTGTKISTGNIEFWPNNYGPGNAANIPGADSKQFDFGDQMSPQPADGHGCMQVHNYAAKQTLFALNNWRSGGKSELGIGNNPNPKGNPDWTFAGNAASYKSKRLRVLVRCK